MNGTPGPQIIGSYRLEEQVGKGGMGEVYRAIHTRLATERAVKLLPPALAADPDFLRRFEREAASAARLEHPNILPVYEYGEAAGGAPYLVMPYVRGGTLKERLARGPLPPAELLDLFGQAAAALDYAHEQGIVHRDVKPANLLLDGRGRLYLADFGIAKALEGAEGLTRTGVGVGTPEYMAPEQAQGRADARSDLYALGVVLYQALTGRVPYSGTSTVEVLMKHLQDPLPLMPLRAVARALAKNPNDRYASGAALVEDLREAFAAPPTPDATVVDATVIDARAGSGTRRTGDTGPGPTVVGGAVGGVQGGFEQQGGGFGSNQGGYVGNQGGAQGGFGLSGGGGGYGGGNQGVNTGNYGGGNLGGGHPPRRSRALLIGGLAGGLVVLLLLCVGALAFLGSRAGGGTPTAQAGGQPTASVVIAANVATAPTVALTAPPTATIAPTATVAPTATQGAVTVSNPPVATTAPTATPVPVAPTATVRPAVAPTATTRPPTVAPTVAPTTKAASQSPVENAPAGWKTYRGSAQAPFALYYPPDWKVDESKIAKGTVSFDSPDGLASFQLSAGRASAGANIDVLRDQYFKGVSSVCDKSGVEGTDYVTVSAIKFAQLVATCDSKATLFLFDVGSGLNGNTEWDFTILSPYKNFSKSTCQCNAGALELYFQPMFTALNIYGNP